MGAQRTCTCAWHLVYAPLRPACGAASQSLPIRLCHPRRLLNTFACTLQVLHLPHRGSHLCQAGGPSGQRARVCVPDEDAEGSGAGGVPAPADAQEQGPGGRGQGGCFASAGAWTRGAPLEHKVGHGQGTSLVAAVALTGAAVGCGWCGGQGQQQGWAIRNCAIS